jgi:hypothetical protein
MVACVVPKIAPRSQQQLPNLLYAKQHSLCQRLRGASRFWPSALLLPSANPRLRRRNQRLL